MKKEDVGTYSCEATNSAGSDKTVGELKTPRYGFEKVIKHFDGKIMKKVVGGG